MMRPVTATTTASGCLSRRITLNRPGLTLMPPGVTADSPSVGLARGIVELAGALITLTGTGDVVVHAFEYSAKGGQWPGNRRKW